MLDCDIREKVCLFFDEYPSDICQGTIFYGAVANCKGIDEKVPFDEQKGNNQLKKSLKMTNSKDFAAV